MQPDQRGASDIRRNNAAAASAAQHGARSEQSVGFRIRSALHTGTSALVIALGIAICAAAPELIWRGMKIALAHASWADLVSMLLIGGIVAFFVEPMLERTRNTLEWSNGNRRVKRRQRALFRAVVSVTFALMSVTIHDAMIAFVSQDDLGGTANGSASSAAVSLVVEWAIVPFAVALAWESVRSRWLAMPIGLMAALSSAFAGWLFAWDMSTVIATAIPCLLIQYLGYRQIKSRPRRRLYVPSAAVVAGSAIAWLVSASLLDASFSFFDLHSMRLYDAPGLLIDVRFYFGWTVGLLIAPRTRRHPASS